jgi:hypothetical protein
MSANFSFSSFSFPLSFASSFDCDCRTFSKLLDLHLLRERDAAKLLDVVLAPQVHER